MEMKITKALFQKQVLEADKPVLVDFWAPWCMPCRMMGPVVEELAEEYEGKAYVGKINVDEEGELAAQYKVYSIPTLIVFSHGQEIARQVGVQSKEALEEMLAE